MKTFLLLLILLVVTSCVSYSKEECKSMNWYAQGQEDGVKGRLSNGFSKYTKSCGKHGISPDFKQYSKGREAGLRNFCTYHGGLRLGQSGRTYEGVCPESLENKFLKGYELGRREYLIEKKEDELRERQEALQAQESEMYLRHTLGSHGPIKKCTFDSDCTIESDCSFSRCKISGKKCSFDSDCDIEGDCSSSTKSCRYE